MTVCESANGALRLLRSCRLGGVLLVAMVFVSACRTEAEKQPATATAVQIGAENVVTVKHDTIVVGPIISGELRPEREATVRAELGGSMIGIAVDEGQTVRRGQLLGRIEAQNLEDARQSAMSAVRSAENQLGVTKREADRTETLVKAGFIIRNHAQSVRAMHS